MCLIISMILFGLNLFHSRQVHSEAVTCTNGGKTCWIFDTVKSVYVSNFLPSDVALAITGNVGNTPSSVVLYLPEGKDPIYNSLLANCQKLALLAQVSPTKVKLRIDSNAVPSSSNIIVNLDISGGPTNQVTCYTVSQ
jgi:hypothetical protein